MENVRPFPHGQADHDGLTTRAPHDAEAEALVIGAVMHDANAYRACAAIIDRDDIYVPAHRLIWDTVAGLVAAGTPPHPVLVRAEIEKAGRLREVEGGHLINRLGADYLPASSAPHFAEQVYETARQRRYDAHANALKAAVNSGATGEELDALVADFHQGEQLRETTGRGPAHLVAALLDWNTFFATDFRAVQLLPGRLMGPGQQITVVGDGKAGKSLFVQEWMWRMATGQPFLDDKPQDPVRILYLDAENGQEQVQERFLSFGAGPQNMGELRYASFPPVRPLDTAGGGADLLSLVKATNAELVVIDTVSRFISGPENDADTWLNLYRHTLLPLKRDRIASVRLDHFGKDKDRGGRGSSAKTQDVDHVWELSAQGGGNLALKRTHTRTGIGPDSFAIVRQARRDGENWALGGTRHVLMTWDAEPGTDTGMAAVPGTVEHIVAQLDKAGVPTGWGSPRVIKRCGELGIQARKSKIEEAVRIRKNRPSGDLPPHLPPSTFNETPPESGGPPAETPGQTSPGEVGGTLPPVVTAPPSPRSPSKEGGGGADLPRDTRTTNPRCDICNQPLNPDWAHRGYTTHIGCDPTTGSHPAA